MTFVLPHLDPRPTLRLDRLKGLARLHRVTNLETRDYSESETRERRLVRNKRKAFLEENRNRIKAVTNYLQLKLLAAAAWTIGAWKWSLFEYFKIADAELKSNKYSLANAIHTQNVLNSFISLLVTIYIHGLSLRLLNLS